MGLFTSKRKRQVHLTPALLKMEHAKGDRIVFDGTDEGLNPPKTPTEVKAILQYLHPFVYPKPITNELKIGRNDPCHCGSGKKYKKCCINQRRRHAK